MHIHCAAISDWTKEMEDKIFGAKISVFTRYFVKDATDKISTQISPSSPDMSRTDIPPFRPLDTSCSYNDLLPLIIGLYAQGLH